MARGLDVACALAASRWLDSADEVGHHTSIAIGGEGLDFIACFDVTNSDLEDVHCLLAVCGCTAVVVGSEGAVGQGLRGSFIASGSGNDVMLDPSLADGGATITSGADLRVLNSATGGTACRLFADGFESGGTFAWSVQIP